MAMGGGVPAGTSKQTIGKSSHYAGETTANFFLGPKKRVDKRPFIFGSYGGFPENPQIDFHKRFPAAGVGASRRAFAEEVPDASPLLTPGSAPT